VRLAVFCLVASGIFPSVSRAQVPVFKVTPDDSSIKYFVKASAALATTSIYGVGLNLDFQNTPRDIGRVKCKGSVPLLEVTLNPLAKSSSTLRSNR